MRAYETGNSCNLAWSHDTIVQPSGQQTRHAQSAVAAPYNVCLSQPRRCLRIFFFVKRTKARRCHLQMPAIPSTPYAFWSGIMLILCEKCSGLRCHVMSPLILPKHIVKLHRLSMDFFAGLAADMSVGGFRHVMF